MGQILLTPEASFAAYKKVWLERNTEVDYDPEEVECLQAIAKDQLKKIGEWGRDACEYGRMRTKRECPLCWQALLKEAEE